MKCTDEFHPHPIPGALREALRPRITPPLPGKLMHLINFPFFVHVSKKEPRLWAYSPTLAHLAQDRQVRTTPGRILKALTKLPDHEIRDLVEDYMQWVARTHPEYEVLWAEDPDAAQAVYENLAPREMENAFGESIEDGEPLKDVCAEESAHPSCMGYHESNYDDCWHPARVYGSSPDSSIAVAYLKDRDGVVARTVCSMKPKTYVRVYQRYKSNGAVHLKALLEAQGFRQSSGLSGVVQATWYSRSDGVLHMPYLDWDTRFDVDEGTGRIHFHGNGDYEATGTGGVVTLDIERRRCDCCGAVFRDTDSLHYVEWDNQEVCDDCLNDSYTYAYTGRYQEYVPNDECEECQDNGEYYTEEGVNYHDLVRDDDGDLREMDCVTWIETLGGYVDNDDVFQDGNGEDRTYREITTDWYLLDGELYESNPGEEGQIQLGTLVYSELWSRKPVLWSTTLNFSLAQRNVSENYRIAQALVSSVHRRVMRYETYGRSSGSCVNVEVWEAGARQYGVTFDEGYNRPIVNNQPERLAA